VSFLAAAGVVIKGAVKGSACVGVIECDIGLIFKEVNELIGWVSSTVSLLWSWDVEGALDEDAF
jgi:hypothetical protein